MICEVLAMNESNLIASIVTALVVVGLVAYRLLWAASSFAGFAGPGQVPKVLKSWRRLLHGEHKETSRS